MVGKKKILFFIVTTLLLGTITFLIIRNTEKKQVEKEIEQESKDPEVIEAVIEAVDYKKYLELRSNAHDSETYAILIWNSDEEVSRNFLEEVKGAFQNRTSIVYTLDIKGLSKEDYSGVIDDVTAIMKYKKPELTVPTLIVMTKGDVLYTRVGFMYKEELRDHLNAKSVE